MFYTASQYREKSMGETEIDLKLWNTLGMVELENNQNQIKVV